MGGTFVAISDDPTGVFYNPAGLVFGFENYISVSANTYNVSSKTYQNIFPGQDYNFHSTSLIPNFFGFSQSYGKSSKLAFAIFVPDSDRLDQDDTLTGISSTALAANTLKRKYFRQDTTYLVGPCLLASHRRPILNRNQPPWICANQRCNRQPIHHL